ncbi:MAG: hypothetical protein E3K32_01115 [wastewater metagenome]|nr:hypothetical protein [Candidatus Loosdrechtia aerotolerans]
MFKPKSMNNTCPANKDYSNITFIESECSDGMCCFTCVIPPNNGHISFLKSFWRNGTGAFCVKLLVMSEGCKNELYDSCKFLDFIISQNSENSNLRMNLRCSIYKSRPKPCMEYPDRAGGSYHKISGPCIYNEYTASGIYKQLVYKRDWQAFFAIRDQSGVIQNIFPDKDAALARELLLKVKDVHPALISEGTKESEYILIPIQKQADNILYTSEQHQPITTIEKAYNRWEEKIQKNLQHHYKHEWEAMLKNAIEMEERDASQRRDEDTARNIKC